MLVVIVGLLAAALAGVGVAARGRRRVHDPLVDPASRSSVRDARRRQDAAEIEASRLRGRHSAHW